MDSEENKVQVRLIQLSNNRFVEISKFRGKTLVSIREFYTDVEGSLRPGKKGISLSLEQWHILTDNIDIINDLITKHE